MARASQHAASEEEPGAGSAVALAAESDAELDSFDESDAEASGDEQVDELVDESTELAYSEELHEKISKML